MKHILYIISFLFMLSATARVLESVPSLPLPLYPDTEVSTNIALRITTK